jgi:hypothetical protein
MQQNPPPFPQTLTLPFPHPRRHLHLPFYSPGQIPNHPALPAAATSTFPSIPRVRSQTTPRSPPPPERRTMMSADLGVPGPEQPPRAPPLDDAASPSSWLNCCFPELLAHGWTWRSRQGRSWARLVGHERRSRLLRQSTASGPQHELTADSRDAKMVSGSTFPGLIRGHILHVELDRLGLFSAGSESPRILALSHVDLVHSGKLILIHVCKLKSASCACSSSRCVSRIWCVSFRPTVSQLLDLPYINA